MVPLPFIPRIVSFSRQSVFHSLGVRVCVSLMRTCPVLGIICSLRRSHLQGFYRHFLRLFSAVDNALIILKVEQCHGRFVSLLNIPCEINYLEHFLLSLVCLILYKSPKMQFIQRASFSLTMSIAAVASDLHILHIIHRRSQHVLQTHPDWSTARTPRGPPVSPDWTTQTVNPSTAPPPLASPATTRTAPVKTDGSHKAFTKL